MRCATPSGINDFYIDIDDRYRIIVLYRSTPHGINDFYTYKAINILVANNECCVQRLTASIIFTR